MEIAQIPDYARMWKPAEDVNIHLWLISYGGSHVDQTGRKRAFILAGYDGRTLAVEARLVARRPSLSALEKQSSDAVEDLLAKHGTRSKKSSNRTPPDWFDVYDTAKILLRSLQRKGRRNKRLIPSIASTTLSPPRVMMNSLFRIPVSYMHEKTRLQVHHTRGSRPGIPTIVHNRIRNMISQFPRGGDLQTAIKRWSVEESRLILLELKRRLDPA